MESITDMTKDILTKQVENEMNTLKAIRLAVDSDIDKEYILECIDGLLASDARFILSLEDGD